MHIGGFLKLTLSDFAGTPSCIVFAQGCNFRCPYCHNGGLVGSPKGAPSTRETDIFDYLKKRAELLSGVVITGGEPCIQQGLYEFTGRVKDLGLAVKLDTNGSRPDVLERLIAAGRVDYIAMDVKAPFSKYDTLSGCRAPLDAIRASIHVLIDSDIEHEFRTTWVRPDLTDGDVLQIAHSLAGARRYVLQTFVPIATLNPAYGAAAPADPDAAAVVRRRIQDSGLACAVR